jgi:hypothetical protein
MSSKTSDYKLFGMSPCLHTLSSSHTVESAHRGEQESRMAMC